MERSSPWSSTLGLFELEARVLCLGHSVLLCKLYCKSRLLDSPLQPLDAEDFYLTPHRKGGDEYLLPLWPAVRDPFALNQAGFALSVFLLLFWRWNPDTLVCQADTLSLSYTPASSHRIWTRGNCVTSVSFGCHWITQTDCMIYSTHSPSKISVNLC